MTTVPLRISPWFQAPRRAERPRPGTPAAPPTATVFQETARAGAAYRGAHARPPEGRPAAEPAFDALHEALLAAADLPDVGRFSLRPVDPPRDLELLHEWMNDPETALYWELDGPVGRVAAHLREQEKLPYTAAYVGVLDGLPMSYWELYRADLDPLLAGRYPAHAGDAGIHLLVGPAGQRGRGVGSALLGDVARRALAAFPQASRVLAEPDVRNVRSVRAFVRAGFRYAAEIDLEGKRAALMLRERAE